MKERFKSDFKNIVVEIVIALLLMFKVSPMVMSLTVSYYFNFMLMGSIAIFGCVLLTIGLGRLSYKLMPISLFVMVFELFSVPTQAALIFCLPILVLLAVVFLLRDRIEIPFIRWVYDYLVDWYVKLKWQFPSYRKRVFKREEERRHAEQEAQRILYEQELIERERLADMQRKEWEQERIRRERERQEREERQKLSPYAKLGIAEDSNTKTIKIAYKQLRSKLQNQRQAYKDDKDALAKVDEQMAEVVTAYKKLTAKERK